MSGTHGARVRVRFHAFIAHYIFIAGLSVRVMDISWISFDVYAAETPSAATRFPICTNPSTLINKSVLTASSSGRRSVRIVLNERSRHCNFERRDFYYECDVSFFTHVSGMKSLSVRESLTIVSGLDVRCEMNFCVRWRTNLRILLYQIGRGIHSF